MNAFLGVFGSEIKMGSDMDGIGPAFSQYFSYSLAVLDSNARSSSPISRPQIIETTTKSLPLRLFISWIMSARNLVRLSKVPQP